MDLFSQCCMSLRVNRRCLHVVCIVYIWQHQTKQGKTAKIALNKKTAFKAPVQHDLKQGA